MRNLTSSVLVAATIFFTGLFGLRVALADDESDAQAVVTAALTARQVQSPGAFGSVTFIENYPYAYMAAGLGLSGKSSMNFALEKVNGIWLILGQGGGYLGLSEMIAFGIPKTDAEKLQGFACSDEPGRRRGGAMASRPAGFERRAFQSETTLPLSVKERVRAFGVSALPRKHVNAMYRGRVTNVTVYQPLDVYRCVL